MIAYDRFPEGKPHQSGIGLVIFEPLYSGLGLFRGIGLQCMGQGISFAKDSVDIYRIGSDIRILDITRRR